MAFFCFNTRDKRQSQVSIDMLQMQQVPNVKLKIPDRQKSFDFKCVSFKFVFFTAISSWARVNCGSTRPELSTSATTMTSTTTRSISTTSDQQHFNSKSTAGMLIEKMDIND